MSFYVNSRGHNKSPFPSVFRYGDLSSPPRPITLRETPRTSAVIKTTKAHSGSYKTLVNTRRFVPVSVRPFSPSSPLFRIRKRPSNRNIQARRTVRVIFELICNAWGVSAVYKFNVPVRLGLAGTRSVLHVPLWLHKSLSTRRLSVVPHRVAFVHWSACPPECPAACVLQG